MGFAGGVTLPPPPSSYGPGRLDVMTSLKVMKILNHILQCVDKSIPTVNHRKSRHSELGPVISRVRRSEVETKFPHFRV